MTGAADSAAAAATLGIVCGMEAEAHALGRWRSDPRVAVAISGGRPDRAEAEARRLATQGVRALLSWGIAGGLDPALAPGALLVPDVVLLPDGSEIRLRPGLTGLPDRALRGLLAGSERLLVDADAKRALALSGAVAVDMETHRVARAAAEAGVPCVALRAVSDPAGRALPLLAAVALDEHGRPRIGAVLSGLARRPQDLSALIFAYRDSRAALAALAAGADVLAELLEALTTGAERQG